MAFLEGDEARIVILFATVIIIGLLGAYLIGKIRSKLRETDAGPSDFMTNFRELHSQGDLSDEEYRTIKASLAARLQKQLDKRGEGRAS